MSSKAFQNQSRRDFIKRATFFAAASSIVAGSSSCDAQTTQPPRSTPRRTVGGGCDGCHGMYEGMPHRLSWQTAVASASEPGERLEIGGIVYHLDGTTPAPNVIIYLWQTDATGYYAPSPTATGFARTHGHLRGCSKRTQKASISSRPSNPRRIRLMLFRRIFTRRSKNPIRTSITSKSFVR